MTSLSDPGVRSSSPPYWRMRSYRSLLIPSGQLAFHQRGLRRTSLVASGWKVTAHHHHDIGAHARQFLGQHHVAHLVIGAAPRDVEQVDGVELSRSEERRVGKEG